MSTLGDELPKEQARVRELMRLCQEIGPAGRFAVLMMEAALREADKAVMSGDIAEMLRAYNDLKGFKE